MTQAVAKIVMFRSKGTSAVNLWSNIIFSRMIAQKATCTVQTENEIHPYRRIHPWNSIESFSMDLVKNIIYNKDGLIVLNKPYGIPVRTLPPLYGFKNQCTYHFIENAVNYSLEETLPYIAAELNYTKLKIMRAPERYTTGVTILTGHLDVEDAVNLALKRVINNHDLYRTFWIVTTMVPIKMKGTENVGLKLAVNEFGTQVKPIIVHSWNHRRKKQNVKPLTVAFQVLSTSKLNLCSLVELKFGMIRWHAVRLFSSTVLFSPVLGDNNCGSRIQNIKGKWHVVNPFREAVDLPPELNPEILNRLKITKKEQNIIPVHTHLRSVYLPSLFGDGQDYHIEAPIQLPFQWTCKQLQIDI